MLKKVTKVFNILLEFSIPLIAGVTTSLLWANLDYSSFHLFINHRVVPIEGASIHFVVNHIFMAFFFGIAAVEITKNCYPGGSLNPLKKAISPLIATAGGVLVPSAMYLLLCKAIGNEDYYRGWGIPTATDIALAWLFARFVFGKGHPAISFLLLLAVADDAIGMLIITFFYHEPGTSIEVVWLLLTLLGIGVSLFLRVKQIFNFWPYLIFGGVLSWVGLYKAHLDPALALIFVVPFMSPNSSKKLSLFEEDQLSDSTLDRFEKAFKVIVDIGLFLFGLANAGVKFSESSTLTWIVLLSLLFGKTIGIFIFTELGHLIGIKRPDGIRKSDVILAGVVASVGLTVSLYISTSAFTDLKLQNAAKMGALFSISGGVLALILGKSLLTRKKSNET